MRVAVPGNCHKLSGEEVRAREKYHWGSPDTFHTHYNRFIPVGSRIHSFQLHKRNLNSNTIIWKLTSTWRSINIPHSQTQTKGVKRIKIKTLKWRPTFSCTLYLFPIPKWFGQSGKGLWPGLKHLTLKPRWLEDWGTLTWRPSITPSQKRITTKMIKAAHPGITSQKLGWAVSNINTPELKNV